MDNLLFNRRVAVAPMLDWTDRHARYFLRLISRHVLLYSEMVHAQAVVQGQRGRLLSFHPAEHPLALQLGGSDVQSLASAARIAVEEWGYDEINLNVGCPSERVQEGNFGACLMAEPDLVARCWESMAQVVSVPVTIKCRIGIDDLDSFAHFTHFIQTVAGAGCSIFMVHARKAWLTGLSPKENRCIPPLRYEWVYELKELFPHLTVVINGGITSLTAIDGHLQRVDGVMIGREAYQNPYFLAEVDRRYFGGADLPPTRADILMRLMPYLESALASGTPLKCVTRHLLGLFQGQPNARQWRRYLTERGHRADAGVEVVREAAGLLGVGL